MATATYAKAGIKAVYICKKGTADTTPANVYYLGLRRAGLLTIEGKDEIKDYRDRPLRNYLGYKAEFDTFQSTMSMLKDIITVYSIENGLDVIIVGEKYDSTPKHDGLFKFTGSNAIGLDFEFIRSDKENSCKFIFESNYEYDTGTDIMSVAKTGGDSALGIPIVQSPAAWLDFTQYGAPYHSSFSFGGNSTGFDKLDIIERKLTFKSVGVKNAYNQTNINYVKCTLEVTSMNAMMDKINTTWAKAQNPAIVISNKAANAGVAATETWTFNAGSLVMRNIFEIGDEKRTAKAIFEGNIPLFDFTFNVATPAAPTCTVSCLA